MMAKLHYVWREDMKMHHGNMDQVHRGGGDLRASECTEPTGRGNVLDQRGTTGVPMTVSENWNEQV